MTPNGRTTVRRGGDPRLQVCPNCQAQQGEPCTQPADSSRRPVSWYHLAREAMAREERSRG